MFPNATANLSSILSIVPLPGKMTIIPLKKGNPIPIPAGLPYVVMFNPESISQDYSVSYSCDSAPGSDKVFMRFNKVDPEVFHFDFLIDGTGASGDKREVLAEVELFKQTVQVDGDLHHPPFLLLVYGTFVKKVIINSMDIQYTMFRKNGTPLRAKIACTFTEHTERLLELLNLNLTSPDLTHRRKVVESNTLPLLCNEIYESPKFYLEAARANGLTTFRKLKTGQELIFPPIEN